MDVVGRNDCTGAYLEIYFQSLEDYFHHYYFGARHLATLATESFTSVFGIEVVSRILLFLLCDFTVFLKKSFH